MCTYSRNVSKNIPVRHTSIRALKSFCCMSGQTLLFGRTGFQDSAGVQSTPPKLCRAKPSRSEEMPFKCMMSSCDGGQISINTLRMNVLMCVTSTLHQNELLMYFQNPHLSTAGW